ncbi:MAG: Flp pilus assembly protein CpaB [Coriobacteriales bacterium]|nr:Flp pilus assembly protein CpaB [Coriobacteriales bacterium]
MLASRKRLLLALAAGFIAVLLLWLYADTLRSEAQNARSDALAAYGGEQVEVFVATRDIAAGETLDSSNTALERWVADLLPAGALSEAAQVLGATLGVSLLKGEPVVEAKLGASFEPVSVPDGLCALTISVDDVQAVGGAIGQGSAVDVYASGASGVILVVSDVLVLETSNGAQGMGSASENSSKTTLFSSPKSRAALKWVTLAVAPRMVQQLLAAARDRNLTLVLPGADASAVAPADVDDGAADEADAAAAAPSSGATASASSSGAAAGASALSSGSSAAASSSGSSAAARSNS